MRTPQIETKDLLDGIAKAAREVAAARIARSVAAVQWDVAKAANEWGCVPPEGADKEHAMEARWREANGTLDAANEQLDVAERRLYVVIQERLQADNLKAAEQAAEAARKYLEWEAV